MLSCSLSDIETKSGLCILSSIALEVQDREILYFVILTVSQNSQVGRLLRKTTFFCFILRRKKHNPCNIQIKHSLKFALLNKIILKLCFHIA